MRQNINIGNFTLVVTLEGDAWAVPGGGKVYHYVTAERIAVDFAGSMRNA